MTGKLRIMSLYALTCSILPTTPTIYSRRALEAVRKYVGRACFGGNDETLERRDSCRNEHVRAP